MIENIIIFDSLLNGGALFLQILIDYQYIFSSVPILDISTNDRNRLVFKDDDYLEKLIRTFDFKKELQYYNLNKNSLKNILQYQKYLDKVLNNKSPQNIFYHSNKKSIVGIGINGLEELSKTPGDDIRLVRDVLRAGREYRSYHSLENEEQRNSVEFSIKSLLGWKNSNLSCMAIGSASDITIIISQLFFMMDDGSLNGTNTIKSENIGNLILHSNSYHRGQMDRYLRSLAANFLIEINENNVTELVSELVDRRITLDNIVMTDSNKSFDTSKLGRITDYNQSDKVYKEHIIERTYGVFNRTIKNILKILKEMLKSLDTNNSTRNIEKSINNTEKQFNLMICSFLIEHFNLTLEIDNLSEPFVELSNNKYEIKSEFKDICKNNSKNYNKQKLLFYYDNDVALYNYAKHDVSFEDKIINFLTSYSGKYNEQIFGVGTTVKNVLISQSTCKVVKSYSEKIIISKKIIIDFLKHKLEVERAGIRLEEIISLSNMIYDNLEMIAAERRVQNKSIMCINLEENLKEKYTSYRASELTYSDEDLAYKLKGKGRYNNNKELETEDFKIIDHKRIYFGLLSIFLQLITALTFDRFLNNNGQAISNDLCQNLLPRIIQGYNAIDADISVKFQEILQKKINHLQIPQSTQQSSSLTNIISFNNFPTVPTGLSQQLSRRLIQMLGFTPGASQGISGGPIGRSQLSSNKTKKILTQKFWITLKNALNDKTIFLPIGNYVNGKFSNKQFLLLDIFASCILGVPKGYINLTKNKMKAVLTKGYILFTNEPDELSDSKKWKIVDRKTISNEFRKGIIKFRINMFNILANNATYNNYTTMNLPYTSIISKNIVSFCKNLLSKSNLKNCDILISRKQFGNGIKSKLVKFNLTKNIDFESGNSYARYSQVSPIKTDDPLRS